jgi:CRISPR-associated protein Cas2
MFIISYDFSDNRERAKFSKFLKKYGRRIQFSVYEIRNSERVLNNIMKEIEYKYKPSFTKKDSIVIIKLCNSCKEKIVRYGYSENETKQVLFFKN